MRDYGKVSTTIWNSRKFASIGDDGRLLYLYLHTCPHVNSVGCFVLKDGYATADLGWDLERYRKGIETLSKASLIGVDTSESLLRIVNFLEFDPFSNINHAKGAIRIALGLPDCEQKLLVLNDIASRKYGANDPDLREGIETLSNGYRTPEPEPEPEPLPKLGGKPPKTPAHDLVREVLCEVMTEATADAYVSHRKAKRAKLTDHAAKLIADKLRDHPQPDRVVMESIANGWTGVFPEKFASPWASPHSLDDSFAGALKQLEERNAT